ncbi:hypothetical protein SDC9_173073 [bioreactor metagenome]|uniref:Uncharacterized protein n=1 Tax=bioreactor metagenome TaxID=1076179 RepID=A0A645GFF9_9ZZZZ
MEQGHRVRTDGNRFAASLRVQAGNLAFRLENGKAVVQLQHALFGALQRFHAGRVERLYGIDGAQRAKHPADGFGRTGVVLYKRFCHTFHTLSVRHFKNNTSTQRWRFVNNYEGSAAHIERFGFQSMNVALLSSRSVSIENN